MHSNHYQNLHHDLTYLENDELFKIDSTWEKIENIDMIETKQNVYNVQMNRVYNYFANDYLVHNGDPCDACDDCGASSDSGEEEGSGEG